jgi:CBS domain-containing protein
MPVGDLCSEDIVTIQKNESLQTAAHLMRDHHVGTVVVVEGSGRSSRPIGILTDRDIVLRVVAEDREARSIPVSEVMTKQLVTVREDEGLFDVISVMRDHGVRRVVVIDSKGNLCGLVSTDELIQMLGEEISSFGKLFELQSEREEDAQFLQH